jgi:hypothetical protein
MLGYLSRISSTSTTATQRPTMLICTTDMHAASLLGSCNPATSLHNMHSSAHCPRLNTRHWLGGAYCLQPAQAAHSCTQLHTAFNMVKDTTASISYQKESLRHCHVGHISNSNCHEMLLKSCIIHMHCTQDSKIALHNGAYPFLLYTALPALL